MSILDRYILRLFLTNFIVLLTVLLTLFVTVDLLIDLDEFTQAGEVYADQYGGRFWATLWVIADFYGPLLVLLYAVVSGLVVFGAMGFTFLALARTREIVAMVTSGLSMYRIAAPVLLVGGLLNLAAIPIHEYIIPPMAEKVSRNKAELKTPAVRHFEVPYAADGYGAVFNARKFHIAEQVLEEVLIRQRDPQGRVVARIEARQALWQAGQRRWQLIEGYRIEHPLTTPPQEAPPSPEGALRDASPAEPGGGEGVADRTATGQAGPAGGGLAAVRRIEPEPLDYIESDLSPQVLLARRQAIFPRVLSLAQLNRLMDKRAVDRDAIMRIAQSRFSFIVVNLLLMLIVLPFYLLREPRNLLWEGTRAALIGVPLWVIAILTLQVGLAGLNPITNAWLPVALYLPLAVWMLHRVRT